MHNYGYTEDGKVGSLLDLRLWKRILTLCRSFVPGFIGAVLLSLVLTIATLGMPRLMQIGIDEFMRAGSLSLEARISGLGRVAGEYAILIGLVFGAGFFQVVLLEWIGQMIMHRLRNRLFHHILGLKVRFFQQQPTGKLVTRLTNDIQNMHEMFTSVLVTLFNDLLKLTGILVALYLMNVRLAMLMTIFLPASLGVTLVFSRLARERFRAIRRQLARLNSFMQEAVANMAVVQIYGRNRKVVSEYTALCDGYLQRTFAQIRLFAGFFPLTEFMSALAVALILWYGGGEVLHKQLSLGQLVAFLSYMRLFFQPLRELSQKYSIVQSAMASAERIFQVLDTDAVLPVINPVYRPPSIRGEVRVADVCFSYDEDAPVLRDLTFTLAPGKVSALVGSTGSGKSTLAGLLVRFYDPDTGTIFLDGVDLRRYPLPVLRTLVGIIMQEVFLLPDTVRENITAGLHVSDDEIDSLIRKTGLIELVRRLPDGLETVIGEGGVELSAGEKQLIAFVRVLARKPGLLIFDEATAAIDTEGENILEQAVEQGFHDRTVLVIAHRLSTVRRADHILVMDQGRIVEQGTHAELIKENGLYAKLVRMDLHGDKE
ncbi:MAG TPA: ABC transporter ATP-binding protein [Desulfobulbus sp.]|nr:ABC transporter ATP-binding protein [Desulfobulbus sp.]